MNSGRVQRRSWLCFSDGNAVLYYPIDLFRNDWLGASKIVTSTVKKRPPNAGKGRPKGSKNKVTSLLKDAVLEAAEAAGDKEGMVGYLKEQASKNPTAFMSLLGKV